MADNAAKPKKAGKPAKDSTPKVETFWEEFESKSGGYYGFDSIDDDGVISKVMISKKLAGDLDLSDDDDIELLESLSTRDRSTSETVNEESGEITFRSHMIGFQKVALQRSNRAVGVTKLGKLAATAAEKPRQKIKISV